MIRVLQLEPDEAGRAAAKGTCEVIAEIGPRNSTVNGYKPDETHEAWEWVNGWAGLDFENASVDGTTSRSIFNGLFGAGHNETYSCGQYLHVPIPDERHGGSYRVRARVQPGDLAVIMLIDGTRFKRSVLSVRAIRSGKWRWVYEITANAVLAPKGSVR